MESFLIRKRKISQMLTDFYVAKKEEAKFKKLPLVELMEAQAEFLFDVETPFIGLAGSFRSGKTYVACLKAVYLASMNIGYNGLMTEPTATLIAGVLIPTFEEVLEALEWHNEKTPGKCWYEIYTSATNPRAELHFPEGDVMIYFRSSENHNRIRGFKVAWFIADEFDTSGYDICKAAWTKMVSRLTKGNKKQGCVLSTKEGYQWMYKYFIKDPNETKKLIEIFVKDNPFIDADYIELMRGQMSQKEFDGYINNLWINFAEGLVYDSYDRVKNRSIETVEKHPNAPLCIGIDFNKRKMASAVHIIINGIPHCVDQFYGAKNTEDLIKQIRRKYGPNKIITYFVDFSGSYHASSAYTEASLTDVQQLQRDAGVDNVKYYQGHLPIIGKKGEPNRVGAVNHKFCNAAGERTYFINDTTCPDIAACFETQGFVNGLPDKADDIDHFPDACGYFISYVWRPTQGKNRVVVQ